MNTLIKIDPQNRIYRWYAVGTQATLIDGLAVIYGWGSLNSTFQHWRTIQVGSHKEAELIIKQVLAKRQKRGYVLRP